MIEHLYRMIKVITFNFISLKTSFLLIINPNFPIKILHILHGHPSGTHRLIWNSNALSYSDYFISLGTTSHIIGPR